MLQLKLTGLLVMGLASSFSLFQDPQQTFQEAIRQLQNSRFSEAKALLSEIIEDYPSHAQSHFLMGLVLTQMGNPREANQFFEKARRLDDKLHIALRAQATNELALGKTNEALAHLSEFLKYVPGDPTAHALLARMAFERGDFQAVIENLQKAPSALEEDLELKLFLQKALLEQGQYERALALLNEDQLDAETDFRVGLQLAEHGFNQEAAKKFALSIAKRPDFPPAQYNLALVSFREGDFQEAIWILEGLMEKGQADFEVHDLLADAYMKVGEDEKFIQLRRKSIELYPEEEKAYTSLILVGLNLLAYDLALEIAARGREKLPDSVDILKLRAWAHSLKGQFDQAEIDYREALSLEPENDWLRVGLASNFLEARQADKALPLLEAVLSKGFEHYLAFHLVGKALLQQDAGDRSALEYLQRSIALEPNFAASRLDLGQLYRRLDEAELAAEQMQKVIELEPENVTAHYQLAQIKRQQGQTEEAKELLIKVQELNRNERAAQDKLSRDMAPLVRLFRQAMTQDQ